MLAAGRNGILDGLRGIAILLVFLIHSGGFGLRAWSLGDNVVDLAKYGVQIFFVVSAYSLCLSIQNAAGKQANIWESYAIRRIFRIIPLYFLVLLAYVTIFDHSVGGILFGGQVDTASVVAHFTFANILFPKYANDIISIEWTVCVEVAFYIVFPLLFIVASRHRSAFVIVTILAAALYFFRDYLSVLLGDEFHRFRSFSIIWNFYAFILGMWCFVLLQDDRWRNVPADAWSAVAIALLVFAVATGDGQHAALQIALAAAALIMAGRHGFSGRFIANPVLQFVGRISYSVYLTHLLALGSIIRLQRMIGGPILFWQFVALAATLVISFVTYRLIEEPARNFGRGLAYRVTMPA